MQIQLKQSFVKELNLLQIEPEGASQFTVEVESLFFKAMLKEFFVVFHLQLKTMDAYTLNMTYVSNFSTDEDITDNFIRSDFPVVNAPAIAYPFVRSLISTITVNSGYPVAILSALNFTKFKKIKVFVDGVEFRKGEENKLIE